MKLFFILALLSCTLIPLTGAVKTGHCTGVYLETGPNHVPGLIQTGDVFEYWCELPSRVPGDTSIQVRLTYPNAQLAQSLFVPRTLYGTYLAVFP